MAKRQTIQMGKKRRKKTKLNKRPPPPPKINKIKNSENLVFVFDASSRADTLGLLKNAQSRSTVSPGFCQYTMVRSFNLFHAFMCHKRHKIFRVPMSLVSLPDKADIQSRYRIRNFYVKQDDKFHSFILLEFRGFMSSYNFFTNQNRAISAGALLPEVDIINSHSKQIQKDNNEDRPSIQLWIEVPSAMKWYVVQEMFNC